VADEPLIWIVDAEQWPRACLRAELIERGYDAVGFVKLAHALAKLARSDQPRPAALVVDVGGQGVTRRQLELVGRKRVPLLLTGGALDLGAPELAGARAAAVLQRPVTLGTIADAVERVAPPSGPRSR
jgi:hypothetical protein